MSVFDINSMVRSRIYSIVGQERNIAYDQYGNVVFATGESGVIELRSALFRNLTSTYSSSSDNNIYASVDYDDSQWERVGIPHDWSIRNNFNSQSPSTYEGGYLDGGDSWYRFGVDTSMFVGRNAYLYFDGVYMETMVYVNGNLVGGNRYGYNPFVFDITEYLTFGNDIIAVFVRNRCPSSRWYSGSGIFRPCHILFTDGVFVDNIQITTPNIENNEGTARVSFTVKGGTHELSIRLRDDLHTLGETTRIFQEGDAVVEFVVENPLLWDINQGNLYYVDFYAGSELLASEYFGFRWFSFTTSGFFLNGRNVKLRGVCMHHDLGCLGAETHKGAIARQVDKLVMMGSNSIRLTHNPSSKIMLDECAKRGILLVEEFFDCWTKGKKGYDFGRYFIPDCDDVIKNTLMRDRNNPAIIMWSIGNEIFSGKGYDVETAVSIATRLYNGCKLYDDRPVTTGENQPGGDPARAVFNIIDVIGLNYGNIDRYRTVINDYPTKPVYGSETTSALSTRGIYKHDDENMVCSSYDNDFVSWGNTASGAISLHFNTLNLLGMFIWTGWDYIGEPTPFNRYPAKSSYFGIIDLAGFPKDIYYMYQSLWTDTPMLHILPHWNWSNGETVNVWVYSNCESVELFLNGTSLGVKTVKGNKNQYGWSVPWQSGTITAIGRNEGSVVCQESITTAGSPHGVLVQKSVYDELCFFEAQVVDEDGNPCPLADEQLAFSVSGGEIIGVDNGDSASVEPFKNTNTRKAFMGKALCVVKPNSGVLPSEVNCTANIVTELT